MESTGESTILKDRYQKEFSVLNYCKHCYNMIYNSVPLSLHQYLSEIEKEKPDSMRLLFTIESKAETAKIVDYFVKAQKGLMGNLPYEEYTNGHYKRGVE
jgi:putative protease